MRSNPESCIFVYHFPEPNTNCVRPHQSLGGKTPAQAARMNVPNNWKGLIDEATKKEAITLVNTLTEKVEGREQLKVISK